MTRLDPITTEILAEGLVAIVREMRATMLKTAYSTILHEGLDFSCALLDAGGQLLAQSEDSPAHIIPLSWQVQEVLRTRPEPLRPGDVLMVNDPYTGGTHLNDVALIHPIFFGGERRFFSVVRAHWGDIGGAVAGSVSGGVADILQEGLRIPPLLVFEEGRENRAVLDLLWANVRVPSDRIGDFYAALSTCRTAERRLSELAERRGRAVLMEVAGELLDRSEARMRERIAGIPPGEYGFEDYIDSDGRTSRPLFLRATITVEGPGMRVDFTGSSPQGPGPMNCSLASATTGVFAACKGLLDPTGAVNQGAFRPIAITAPPRCFLNAGPPVACGGFSEIRRRVASVVLGALSRAVPMNLVGDAKGTSNHVNIGCPNPARGGVSILYEYPSGGTGAFREHDGSHTCRAFDEGEFGSIQPVEVVEAEHPVLVESCRLRTDSEGSGFRRGGLGMRREIRILSDHAQLSILSDRNVIPPFGVLGGFSGSPNAFHVRRDGALVSPSSIPGKVTGFPLRCGDVVVIESAGGGGYGDPLEREAALVARDVARGYVTPERARACYGVVFADGRVDGAATARERERRRADVAARLVMVEAASDDVFRDGRRRVPLGRSVASALGVADGALIELVPAAGAPLRAWVTIGEGGGVALGPWVRRILGVTPGDRVLLRTLQDALAPGPPREPDHPIAQA